MSFDNNWDPKLDLGPRSRVSFRGFHCNVASFPGRLLLRFLDHIRDLCTTQKRGLLWWFKGHTYLVNKESGRRSGNEATAMYFLREALATRVVWRHGNLI